MITTQPLTLTLVKLGFAPTPRLSEFRHPNGLQVQLLDGPRLRLHSPAGAIRFVAILDPEHLQAELGWGTGQSAERKPSAYARM